MPSDIPSYHAPREFVCPAPFLLPSDDDVVITEVKRNPARGARTRVPMKDRKDSGPSSGEEEEFIISKECANDNMLFSSDLTDVNEAMVAPIAAVPATGVNAPMTKTVVTETFRNGKLVKRETISEVSSAGGHVAALAPRPTPSVAPKAKAAQPKKRKSPVVDEDREEMCTWVYMKIGTVERWRPIRVVDPVDPATQSRGGAERVSIATLVAATEAVDGPQ